MPTMLKPSFFNLNTHEAWTRETYKISCYNHIKIAKTIIVNMFHYS
jgi:hypothetical protein